MAGHGQVAATRGEAELSYSRSGFEAQVSRTARRTTTGLRVRLRGRPSVATPGRLLGWFTLGLGAWGIVAVLAMLLRAMIQL